MNVINVNSLKGLDKYMEIGSPVAVLIMADHMQPLAQEALQQKLKSRL